MPCLQCRTQFTIFKRKKFCNSCSNYFCNGCLKKDKNASVCLKCKMILEIAKQSNKNQLMQLSTKDLKFFLQSRKINIAGIVEKEELCNLIINHLNNSTYYEPAPSTTSSSNTPNNDFENYAQSFDQIKQTCQNIFTSITDKIASGKDLQKTTCFNNQPNQQRHDNVTTQQPRPRARPMSPPLFQFWSPTTSPPTSPQQPQQTSYSPGTSQNSANRNHQEQPSTSDLSHNNNNNNNNGSSRANPKTNKEHHDCECSDDEMYEISEKRQNIFDSNATGSGNILHSNAKKTKLSNSSSIDSSSFEEVVVAGKSDDDWLFVEKSKGKASSSTADKSDDINQSSSPSQLNLDDTAASSSSYIPNSNVANVEAQRLLRRRSDSSLLSWRKTGTITTDASSINLLQGANEEVKKVEISCRKCGKAKSKIKEEILKLSEQLKSSNRSAEEINAKINEFMEYLESNHASEMTEIDDTHANAATNEPLIPSSSPHDEIEENIFDENEGINVYGSEEIEQIPNVREVLHEAPSSSTSTPRRFISLDDIHSSDELESMNVKQLKEILMLNRVNFKGCCEKNELKERVKRLWESHVSAPPPEQITTDDLCKICMDAPIECVFLECGHTATCTACGKVLSECPICRSYIVRVVRIFKS